MKWFALLAAFSAALPSFAQDAWSPYSPQPPDSSGGTSPDPSFSTPPSDDFSDSVNSLLNDAYQDLMGVDSSDGFLETDLLDWPDSSSYADAFSALDGSDSSTPEAEEGGQCIRPDEAVEAAKRIADNAMKYAQDRMDAVDRITKDLDEPKTAADNLSEAAEDAKKALDLLKKAGTVTDDEYKSTDGKIQNVKSKISDEKAKIDSAKSRFGDARKDYESAKSRYSEAKDALNKTPPDKATALDKFKEGDGKLKDGADKAKAGIKDIGEARKLDEAARKDLTEVLDFLRGKTKPLSRS